MASEDGTRNPWLDPLLKVQGLAAAVAGIAAALSTIAAFFGLLQSLPWWGRVGLAAVALFCVHRYVLLVRVAKRRRRFEAPPLTVFQGPQAFLEGDRASFFGREPEIALLKARLTDPHGPRVLVLYGESGSGKTSLIRAGVIPALAEVARASYVRVYDTPVQRVRDALRRAQGTGGSPGAPPEPPASSLVDELARAARGGAPLVLFVDQAEELFAPTVAEEERLALRELVSAAVSTGTARIVFAVRRDAFDRMAYFEACYSDIFRESGRVLISRFDDETAHRVIHRSLASSGNATLWDVALCDAIVKDLEAGAGARGRATILPAELQIVCRMVQRHRITKASEYPGKEQLIDGYVDDVVASTPDPRWARDVLRALIDWSSLIRRPPVAASTVAEELGGSAETVARYLKHFDEDWHLVNSTGEDAGVRQFELSHDYLIQVLKTASAPAASGVERSRALLLRKRRAAAWNLGGALSLREAWHVLRNPPPEMTERERRSVRASLYGSLTGVVVAGGALTLPGLVYVSLELNPGTGTYVVSKGRPWFFDASDDGPKILVDTGVRPYPIYRSTLAGVTAFLDPWPLSRGRRGATRANRVLAEEALRLGDENVLLLHPDAAALDQPLLLERLRWLLGGWPIDGLADAAATLALYSPADAAGARALTKRLESPGEDGRAAVDALVRLGCRDEALTILRARRAAALPLPAEAHAFLRAPHCPLAELARREGALAAAAARFEESHAEEQSARAHEVLSEVAHLASCNAKRPVEASALSTVLESLAVRPDWNVPDPEAQLIARAAWIARTFQVRSDALKAQLFRMGNRLWPGDHHTALGASLREQLDRAALELGVTVPDAWVGSTLVDDPEPGRVVPWAIAAGITRWYHQREPVDGEQPGDDRAKGDRFDRILRLIERKARSSAFAQLSEVRDGLRLALRHLALAVAATDPDAQRKLAAIESLANSLPASERTDVRVFVERVLADAGAARAWREIALTLEPAPVAKADGGDPTVMGAQ